MNSVIISGRLTRDPELRFTQNGIAVAKFTLAVPDDFKNAQGEREVNFIDITAWRQTAEFITNHSAKGLRLAVQGRLKQEKWTDKEGQNRSKVAITAEKVEPIDWADQGRQEDEYQRDLAFQDEDSPF